RYGYEMLDPKQYADWGFDYLKHDWCGYRAIVNKLDFGEAIYRYKLMAENLEKTGRDIVLSAGGANEHVWTWGSNAGLNAWRTTGDIRDNWERVKKIGFSQDGLENYAGPGHWNDPDMLVVGYVGWTRNVRPTYLSPNEQYAHISLWSLLAAPLLIGAD